MNKSNKILKYLKIISKSINSLLEQNLNKLKLDNLINLSRSNKIVLIFVALFILSLSYLLIPTLYKQNEVNKELKLVLKNSFNLNFEFYKNLNYNFFPRPHFTSKKAKIFYDNNGIAEIKKLKIYISLENLFSLKKIQVKDVVIEDTNFNLNQKNYNYFITLLENKFDDKNLKIKNSNIFFVNSQKEVLFINKIKEMKYFYDVNELRNILYTKNELFNIPYEIKFYNDNINKKLFSKLNLHFLKLQIENEFNYKNNIKTGKADLIINKSKSTNTYKIDNNLLEFKFFDKLDDYKFLYKGVFNLNPFYSTFEGKTKILNLNYFLNPNMFFVQFLKTELLNKKNIDLKFKIHADKIKGNTNFVNLNLTSKIQEGLIDMDNTKFEWKNFVNFYLSDSLIFVKNGELILDGKLNISINNYNEIYKYLLTPKNYRKKLKNIDLNFSYNFDNQNLLLNDIRIDSEYNQKINKIMSNIELKENNLQNKIYLKKLLNHAIKSYSG